MTTITNSLSNYAGNFNFQDLKAKAHGLASRFFTIYTYPNEHPLTSIARIAFEFLAAAFITCGVILGGPPLALGFISYQLFAPSEHYIIENATGGLKNEVLIADLKKLIAIQQQFKCIEIRSATPLALNEETINLIKQLHPPTLIMPLANQENVINQLETFSHYYFKDDQNACAAKSGCRLIYKEKIKHLVLPQNPEEIIKILSQLVEKKERVNKVYYTTYIHASIQSVVKEMMLKLGSPLEFLFDNKKKLSSVCIEAQFCN